MKVRTILLGSLGCAALVLSIGGCTALGTYMGWKADQTNARRDLMVTWQHPDSLLENYPVKVKLASGRTLSAVYMGQVDVPETEYRTRYEARREELSTRMALPPLDDLLTITKPSGQQFRLPFAGFDQDVLVFWNSSTGRHATISCTELDTIENDEGLGYSPHIWNELLLSRQVPLRTGILLRYDGKPFSIPLDEVVEIRAGPKKTNNWAFGLAVGVITDALITGAIIRASQK
jgi:hypothetical protein